jgi:hypothetical protein
MGPQVKYTALDRLKDVEYAFKAFSYSASPRTQGRDVQWTPDPGCVGFKKGFELAVDHRGSDDGGSLCDFDDGLVQPVRRDDFS